MGTLDQPAGLAFVGGDLWVAARGSRYLVRFSAEQVAAGGTVQPMAVMTAEAMGAPSSLAVDATGNLWVGANGSEYATPTQTPGTLVRFNPSELRRAGRVTGSPDVVLSEGSGLPHNHTGLLFIGGDLLVPGDYYSSAALTHVSRLGASQLTASGTPTPVASFLAAEIAFDSPEDLAFDKEGALWVASCGTHSVVKYPQGTWGVTGRFAPSVTLRLPQLTCPRALAFDLEGNLWVAGAYTLGKFVPSRLRASGEVMADVKLDLAEGPSQYSFVQGMAFDTANTLWVTRVVGMLESYVPSARVSSGIPAPAVRIEFALAQQNAFNSRLAFDSSGALVVSVPNANQVLRYAPEQLMVSGAPAPKVLTVDYYPTGLAFDREGHLWVASSGALTRLAPAALLSSGTPEPEVRLPMSIGGGSLAFSPALP